MAAGNWVDWNTGDLVTEAAFQDIQDSIVFIYANESAADAALTNKVEGTIFYDTTDDVIKAWDGSAWISAETGDITAVNTAANSGLAGGATSGAVSLTVDPSNLASGVTVDSANDLLILEDVTDGTVYKVTPDNLGLGGSFVLIDNHDFSAVSSITRDSVFSSTYDNYKIFINITDGSATAIQIGVRLRASSTSTTTNYAGHRNYVSTGGTAVHGSSTGTTYLYLADVDSGSTDVTCSDITLFAPNLAAPTKYLAQGQGFFSSSFYSQQIYAFQSDNTQFDGIEVYPFSPGGVTISGNIQIFGMKQ